MSFRPGLSVFGPRCRFFCALSALVLAPGCAVTSADSNLSGATVPEEGDRSAPPSLAPGEVGSAGQVSPAGEVGSAGQGGRGSSLSGGGPAASSNSASGGKMTAEAREYVERCGDGQLLTGVVRDFSPVTHPDFEPADAQLRTPDVRMAQAKHAARELGMVRSSLGPDFKPVYAGHESNGTLTTYGAAWFQSWFRDTAGLNASKDVQLELTDADGDGVFVFDNYGQPFLPIDRELLGGSQANTTAYSPHAAHNYSFTYELHATFVYNDEKMLIGVTGNDDLWVFINGRLVIDLGGLGTKTGRIWLKDLGLTPNHEYQLAVFGAERQAPDATFALETNVRFTNCALPVPR